MPLDERYRVKTERSRFIDRIGAEQWTLVFEVPTANIPDERANFRASLDNILPGHDSDDVFAPCIHDSYVDIDPENRKGKLVTCVYQRPTTQMILRPGRGLLEFSSYSTVQREEVAIYRKHDYTVEPVVTIPSVGVQSRVSLKKEQATEIIERGVLKCRIVDWASNEMTVYARAAAWIGKGDEPQTRSTPKPGITINGQLFYRLKCSAVTIQRRPGNVAIVDSLFEFAMKDEKWEESGVITDTWYATNLDGTEVTYDPDADPAVRPSVPYMALKLRNYDLEVVSGYTDFTPIQSYYTWMEA